MDFPYSALGYVRLFRWDYDFVRLPMVLCLISFQFSRLLIHQFHERRCEGQEKGVKEGKFLNGKEGVLSAGPSAYDENGKKEIT